MYPSRGGNGYGQQSYSGQSGFSQKGTAYLGSSVTGTDGGSRLSLSSQHSSIRGGIQDADISVYRGHSSNAAHYDSQYSSAYLPASFTGSHQILSAKGTGQSSLESRGSYASAIADSPKITSSDYLSSSSHAYSRKSDTLYTEKVSDLPSIEKRQYAERQGSFSGRDLLTEPMGRFSNSSFSRQLQTDIYDPIDRPTLLRGEQLLKAQSLQSNPLDGTWRKNDYLATRGAVTCHSNIDLASYGGRIDADPRSLSLLSDSPYRRAEAPSILGAAPQRNVNDLLYTQSTSNPGYGVSLPPGRDYSAARRLHGIESNFSSALLPRGGHPRVEEHKDDRASYLRDFDLREEERRRDRSQEREREKAREGERERERAREMQCLTKRRGKEREQKRFSETRQKRTPRDRHASSLTKDVRPLWRDTPRHEATHRRHSSLKPVRREYVCKVYSCSLVALERDYLSIDKRYPRLFVSPELSKVVVHWPKENIKLSLHTPVSFEHDFIEAYSSTETESSPTKICAEDYQSECHQETVWNAKVILMSGLSRSALETLSSDKSLDDHVPHICNILRFAVLKRDRALMAIGGPCGSIDGSNPSVDDSALIQSALRYAKGLTQVDLRKCQQWNRFLEIHYDRIGIDGIFSHREVTVLFIPDLSDCLPSLEKWKEQWLAHKNAVSEKEHGRSTKKEEKSGEKMEGSKVNDASSSKGAKKPGTSKQSNDSVSSLEAGKGKSIEKQLLKESVSDEKVDLNDKNNKDGPVEVGKIVEGKKGNNAQISNAVKPAKKKVQKIVKQKVSNKMVVVRNDEQPNEKPAEKVTEEDKIKSEDAAVQSEELLGCSSGVKTSIRKTVVKKVASAEKSQKQDVPAEVKDQMEVEGNNGKPSEIVGLDVAVDQPDSTAKTAIKKKIIKKVPKKKSGAREAADNTLNKDEAQNIADAGNSVKSAADVGKQNDEVDKPGLVFKPLEPVAPVKKDGSDESAKAETKGDSKNVAHKDPHGTKNLQEREKANFCGDKRDAKLDDSAQKSDEDPKGKKRLEEPPRPGFILCTNGSKDHKPSSLSVSLDSLLDYSDKDIEESNFELSLFAESLYEMLQYQMGYRVLDFLQKLRDFIRKTNQQKRKREETDDADAKRSSKLTKTSGVISLDASIKSAGDNTEEGNSIIANTLPDNKIADDKTNCANNTQPDIKTDEKGSATANLQPDEKKELDASNPDHVDDTQMLDVLDGEHEEDPDEYEEVEEETSQPDDAPKVVKINNTGIEQVVGDKEATAAAEPTSTVEDTMIVESQPTNDGPIPDKKDARVETKKKSRGLKKEDKELIQAFHFFDRNRTGYIRVEDMRLIIHSLGKFLSHCDVKELVQTALLSSNNGRDDRIFYGKLIGRMSNG